MEQDTKHNSPLAFTYARALLELASAEKRAEDIGSEMKGLGEVLTANPVFREFLANPGITDAERTAAVQKIFQGRISPLVFNFLGVLNNHRRLGILTQVISAYAELLDKQLGNVEVEVTTAQPLGPDQLEQVRQRVSQSIGKNAIMHPRVDESILGGLVIRVGDQSTDASVRYQLQAMREQLLSAARKRPTAAI